jgi:hypothetical protein
MPQVDARSLAWARLTTELQDDAWNQAMGMGFNHMLKFCMVPFETFGLLIQESYDAKLEDMIKVAKHPNLNSSSSSAKSGPYHARGCGPGGQLHCDAALV